jgi:hypothetical protein
VTKFIASKHSRQEFEPPLGKYIDRIPDPLHNANNAWQKKWHSELLPVALKMVTPEMLKKATMSVNCQTNVHLPSTFKFKNCLETQVKCGRLVKNLK